jgi:hypothetical protein
MSQDIDLDSWSDSIRAWPNPPEGWVVWYNRVANTYQPLRKSIGIADALSLSLSPLEKDENLLKTIGYFWSDALNCFLFGHGPMTWSNDPNSSRCYDDYRLRHLIILSLCLYAFCSPLQAIFQSRVHKLEHISEPTPENKRTCDRERTHGLPESMARALSLLRPFTCSNKKLSSSGVRAGQRSHYWPW